MSVHSLITNTKWVAIQFFTAQSPPSVHKVPELQIAGGQENILGKYHCMLLHYKFFLKHPLLATVRDVTLGYMSCVTTPQGHANNTGTGYSPGMTNTTHAVNTASFILTCERIVFTVPGFFQYALEDMLT